MTFPIVDAHCHLCDYKAVEIRPGWLPVTVGYSHPSNVKNAAIAAEYKLPYALGIAPQTAVKEGISKMDTWIDEVKRHRPNAIGEIGLDFHWAKTGQHVKDEHALFSRMLDLAEEMKLPVVIHSRESQQEVERTLRERKMDGKIMFHFFSGTQEEAERAVGMGALVSIPPLPSKERRKVIKSLELENLLVETDSPYVVRTFYEVERAIEYVAEVKGLDKGVVAGQTAKNAIRFFGIGNGR